MRLFTTDLHATPYSDRFWGMLRPRMEPAVAKDIQALIDQATTRRIEVTPTQYGALMYAALMADAPFHPYEYRKDDGGDTVPAAFRSAFDEAFLDEPADNDQDLVDPVHFIVMVTVAYIHEGDTFPSQMASNYALFQSADGSFDGMLNYLSQVTEFAQVPAEVIETAVPYVLEDGQVTAMATDIRDYLQKIGAATIMSHWKAVTRFPCSGDCPRGWEASIYITAFDVPLAVAEDYVIFGRPDQGIADIIRRYQENDQTDA